MSKHDNGVRPGIHRVASQFEIDESRLRRRSPKNLLTTRIGRVVDSISYGGIFLLSLLTLVISTGYFYLVENSIKDRPGRALGFDADQLIDSLYFSVVTFTSLGYGDVLPDHNGKLIASCVALLGLVLVALFVGKIASERQFSLLLLLHTSDVQRRLMGFCADLLAARQSIMAACQHPQGEGLSQAIEALTTRVAVIEKYVLFHCHQAQLTRFGNNSALGALYVNLDGAQQACAQAFRTEYATESVGKRALEAMVQMAEIVSMLARQQKRPGRSSPKGWSTTEEILPAEEMRVRLHELRLWSETHASNWLILKARECFLVVSRETPSDRCAIEVARWLGIAPELAQQCIDAWPHRLKGAGKIQRPPPILSARHIKKKIDIIDQRLKGRLMALDRSISKGGPLTRPLEELKSIVDSGLEDMVAKGAAAEWRELHPTHMETMLTALARVSTKMKEISDAGKFNSKEIGLSEAVAGMATDLAELIVHRRHGIHLRWFDFWPTRLVLAAWTPAAYSDWTHAASIRSMCKPMTLTDMFAVARNDEMKRHTVDCGHSPCSRTTAGATPNCSKAAR